VKSFDQIQDKISSYFWGRSNVLLQRE